MKNKVVIYATGIIISVISIGVNLLFNYIIYTENKVCYTVTSSNGKYYRCSFCVGVWRINLWEK